MNEIENSSILFSDVMYEWIRIHSLLVAESTTYNYMKAINRLTGIGSEYVGNISQRQLQEMFIDFMDEGLSTNTMKEFSKVIKQALDFAVNQGYIQKSPYHDIVIPKMKKDEIKPFTIEEVRKLLSLKMKDWIHDAIEISFRTGMRKGEIFALEKDCIDFDKNFLTVKQTQTLDKNGKVIIGKPKTRASRRRIDLDESTMKILWRRCSNNNSSFIFAYSDGRMLIPHNLSATVTKKCRAAGIYPHRFHDLRHGHATYLLINNVHPKVVQERLGHANIGMTLDTYSHLIPGLQRAAVDAIGKMQF